MKKCVEIREMLFKNWKLLFKKFCRNTCGWKSVWKYVKCCLKTENCCLETLTKHPLSFLPPLYSCTFYDGHTIRAVQTRPKPDNPAKSPDDNPIPARTEGPVGRRQVSVLKNRHRWVEWRVRISKTRATRTDRSYKKIRPNPAKTSQIRRDLDQI